MRAWLAAVYESPLSACAFPSVASLWSCTPESFFGVVRKGFGRGVARRGSARSVLDGSGLVSPGGPGLVSGEERHGKACVRSGEEQSESHV